MAKLLTGGLAAVVTYVLSLALYLLAALAYGFGLRPMVYGGLLELITGFVAMGVVIRERPDEPWLVVLTGIGVGRSLRGITEAPVLQTAGGLSAPSSVALVCVRVLLVLIGAGAAVALRRWRSQGSVA